MRVDGEPPAASRPDISGHTDNTLRDWHKSTNNTAGPLIAGYRAQYKPVAKARSPAVHGDNKPAVHGDNKKARDNECHIQKKDQNKPLREHLRFYVHPRALHCCVHPRALHCAHSRSPRLVRLGARGIVALALYACVSWEPPVHVKCDM